MQELKAGTKVEARRNVYWLAPYSLLSYIPSDTAHIELGPPILSLINKTLYRLACRQSDRGIFSSEALFSQMHLSSFQADKKIKQKQNKKFKKTKKNHTNRKQEQPGKLLLGRSVKRER